MCAFALFEVGVLLAKEFEQFLVLLARRGQPLVLCLHFAFQAPDVEFAFAKDVCRTRNIYICWSARLRRHGADCDKEVGRVGVRRGAFRAHVHRTLAVAWVG